MSCIWSDCGLWCHESLLSETTSSLSWDIWSCRWQWVWLCWRGRRGFWWNDVSEWEWRDGRQREEGQQAGRAEMWLLCETGKCGEYPATHDVTDKLCVCWKALCAICDVVSLSLSLSLFLFSEKAGRGVSSPWMNTQSATSSPKWWGDRVCFIVNVLFFLSVCVTGLFVCTRLSCVYVRCRIRSLSEPFLSGTSRGSMNASSSLGESSVNHWVEWACSSLSIWCCVWAASESLQFEFIVKLFNIHSFQKPPSVCMWLTHLENRSSYHLHSICIREYSAWFGFTHNTLKFNKLGKQATSAPQRKWRCRSQQRGCSPQCQQQLILQFWVLLLSRASLHFE